MKILIKVLLLVIAAVVCSRVYTLWSYMKFGKVVYNHAPGPCRTIKGVDHGSEDMQVTSSGKAFISSGLKCYLDPSNPLFQDRNGKILLFDFNKPNDPIKTLAIKGDIDTSDWGPHGVSVLEDKKGSVFVFAVVHRPSGESIEKFKYLPDSDSLEHQQTYISEQFLKKLNDVAAVSEDSFYSTNMQYYNSNFEGLFGLRWGNVVFYDGKNFKVVATDLFCPNGLIVSPDGKYLYVATGESSIAVYERNPDNTLKFLRNIPIYTAPDNIDVDAQTGDMWLGTHPIPHKTINYLYDPSFPTPSQVLRLEMKSGDVKSMTEVYMDDGEVLKGSTISARYKDAFLVGTAHDKLLYCEIKHI